MPTKRKSAGYAGIIQAVSTPLGFYVLGLLIIEGTMSVVLTWSKLSEPHVWTGFLVMLALFASLVVVVSCLVIWFPKNLLYGKEEHANPMLEASALRDQIEDLIAANVNAECLKKPNT